MEEDLLDMDDGMDRLTAGHPQAATILRILTAQYMYQDLTKFLDPAKHSKGRLKNFEVGEQTEQTLLMRSVAIPSHAA